MRIENAALVKRIRKAAGKWCELCHREPAIHTHHEPTWGSTGQETGLTVFRICKNCHDKRHGGTTGEETAEKIRQTICLRQNCTPEDRQKVINLIWRADKDAKRGWFEWQAQDWAASAVALLEKTLREAGI